MSKKNFLLYSGIFILILSLAINLRFISTHNTYTNVLLTEYKSELERSQSLLQEYITQEGSSARPLHKSLSALDSAIKIAELLGKHSSKYSSKNDVEVYLNLPDIMSAILQRSIQEPYSKDKIKSVKQTNATFLKNIDSSNIKSPKKIKKIYNEAISEINKNLLPNNMP